VSKERLMLVAVLVWAGLCRSVGAGMLYDSFPDSQNLVLNGRAAVVNSALRVANNSGPLAAGSAWYKDQVDVVGGFTAEFDFRIHTQGSSFGLADGLAFVVQSSPQGTSALGYGGGGARLYEPHQSAGRRVQAELA